MMTSLLNVLDAQKRMPIKECEYLKTCHTAAIINRVVCVSPAMMSLIKGAETQKELKRVLSYINVTDLGAFSLEKALSEGMEVTKIRW